MAAVAVVVVVAGGEFAVVIVVVVVVVASGVAASADTPIGCRRSYRMSLPLDRSTHRDSCEVGIV